jgi:hypothetical protein
MPPAVGSVLVAASASPARQHRSHFGDVVKLVSGYFLQHPPQQSASMAWQCLTP